MINLIGISGRMGSGKDTVAKIIQYLTNPFDIYMGNAFFVEDDYRSGSPWKNVKFAAKPKQIASILTDIPVEKFEDQEFKKTTLGPEWDFYCIVNKAADAMYQTEHEYSWPYATEQAARKMMKSLSSNPNYTVEKKQMTVRRLLQWIGTNAIRNNVHPNAWVNALFADYIPYPCSFLKDRNGVRLGLEKWSQWLIPDTRFPNEAQAIKDRGGIVVRINRPLLGPFNMDVHTKESPDKLHPSETALDNWDFDYCLDNSGTLEDLVENVRQMLIHFKIIEHATSTQTGGRAKSGDS